MNPIDPKETTRPQDETPMAPPFVDENTEREAVERGLDVAENETRDAVTDIYEGAARRSDDPEESLDDIDYEEEQARRKGPDHEPGSI
jgi:hypothetical protein